MKTGTADLPLHSGKCPAWLFEHMKKLSAAIIEVILEEKGREEVLYRLSHPYWFQALGCVVGFDWHSSGLTTTLCGAIKEGLSPLASKTGIFFAGGKGKTAVNTPQEINTIAEKNHLEINPENLIYASKMAAKVDNAAVQDGYQIYHHFFVFTQEGNWAVIQQGMNEDAKQARRYHWLSLNLKDFTNEPHTAICCNHKNQALNLVAKENYALRTASTELAQSKPEKILKELKLIEKDLIRLKLPFCHYIPNTRYLNKSLQTVYEKSPHTFEELLAIPGAGPGTIRALCLVAEVAYGIKASFEDPVRYSFAHGGKDGFPFPVNEADLEHSYQTLRRALKKAKAGNHETLQGLKRLAIWHAEMVNIKATPKVPEKTANNPSSPLSAPQETIQLSLF
ncbi:hypothetical protein SAMN02745221_01087 [Thermosyntropha lipolytica DSM 11003]|uniref:DUF763 domain-containing protein n=1 Tax=Thermosyntropha lipolytica DSM 11003 TaxID=1123382 RepID=A0A1M5N2P2_9FIRM|nr:DUF763 domain-containing protein [Thermosyntropha lipolytica]SHG83838.1 hypothetical protein SAMN02745221_01087 [Thermosyntropha lipolytica DSM 11003]